ncbi:MurR/RpiR family transcriptional regulator [Arthrobacter cupressi]|uniref:Transcriptional regulator, RpiR family n=1 Tax=Arthrobacter cupressi TaxID=1045773 RepID=A0A1G8JZZ9_9MICC|nr:MurR/RpiR family transcriptional regulator [Arthrobacter cupressi]NYD77382.1 DNA-binding MurR/RpiR family transcriptional regulator [Arthrobacter cupressi]SDI36687.1 transcriptional regulator, RpiR family [Arthrobacter cupressi]
MNQEINSSTLTEWLDSRVQGRKLAARQLQVIGILRSQPRLASYGSVSDIAAAAASNASTVTRTAQTLGFKGWADFQFELRSRFLASLSAVEVAAQHNGHISSPAQAAVSTDRTNLAHLERTLDPDTVHAIAQAIAGARRTFIIAAGSYAIPGKALEHNAIIAGHDVRLLDADVAALSNAVARLTPEDLVIVISLWRVYDSTLRAIEAARTVGTPIASITDSAGSPVAEHATQRIVVPTEGAGFFPSLTGAVAAVQAIAVELASLDRERSTQNIGAAERSWELMKIMHPRSSS